MGTWRQGGKGKCGEERARGHDSLPRLCFLQLYVRAGALEASLLIPSEMNSSRWACIAFFFPVRVKHDEM